MSSYIDALKLLKAIVNYPLWDEHRKKGPLIQVENFTIMPWKITSSLDFQLAQNSKHKNNNKSYNNQIREMFE